MVRNPTLKNGQWRLTEVTFSLKDLALWWRVKLLLKGHAKFFISRHPSDPQKFTVEGVACSLTRKEPDGVPG